ncbi:MAG: helix-turn-helix transcriptional regulator [SAR324 cluster bacterium]|nr:helix-turn-helix transcriptional regulator [SAR324 cluster bacterium]
MSKLNEMILEFREDIGQSIEGLALLMQMDPQEYARLEKDWIPPDETLQRLCALFEWNYQEIKRLADVTPSAKKSKTIQPNQQSSSVENNSAESAPTPLAKLIKDAREAFKQDELGIATLLGISVDYYQEFENGVIPPDEFLRKLCSLFGWNYKQILQKINSQSSVLLSNQPSLLHAIEIQARLPKQEVLEIPEVPPPVPLHEQILQARMNADQNVEGISILLQINPELYEQIESGTVNPDPDLLKRISSLFGWNYNELLNREKSSHFSQLLPAITSLDSPDSSITEIKLRKILQEIAENWQGISKEQQQILLTQLEFLRGSMENMDHEN